MVYSKDILRKPGSRKALGMRDVLSTLETLRKRLTATGADRTSQALVLVVAAQLALVDAKASRLTHKHSAELEAALALVAGQESLLYHGGQTSNKGKSSRNAKLLSLSPRGKD